MHGKNLKLHKNMLHLPWCWYGYFLYEQIY